MSRLARVPLRVKLTLVFAVAMAAVLVTVGWFLHLRLRDDIDASIRNELRVRAGALAASVRTHWPRRDRLLTPGERYAQVLLSDGTVVAGRPQDAAPLLSPLETVDHLRRTGYVERPEHTRLLAVPVRAGGRRVVAVVASSLAQRESAIENLGAELALGGALALLLACAAAYGLASAALRPVEHMRVRAEEITAADPRTRLPVPASRDEIGRLAETLNAMLARLSEAAEHERSFAANASHELRTPISALRMELELALRHETDASSLRAAVQAALADTDRLSRVADDLLVLARADSGRLPIQPERVRIAPIVEKVVRQVRAPGRATALDVAPELALEADPTRLEQALRNLVENAVHHGSGTIAIAASAGERRVVLSVHDEGGPIAPEILEHAFDRFATFQAGDRGVGLGLPIVRVIAEAHGGSIVLDNDPGGGVTARLELPAPAG